VDQDNVVSLVALGCCTDSHQSRRKGILKKNSHPVVPQLRKYRVNISRLSVVLFAPFGALVVGVLLSLVCLFPLARIKSRPGHLTCKEFCTPKVGQLRLSLRDIKQYQTNTRTLFLHV